MTEPELSLLFLRPLNRIGGRYIVSGSVASILYGEPRLTPGYARQRIGVRGDVLALELVAIHWSRYIETSRKAAT